MPLDDAQAVSALTVLTRLAQRDPHAVEWIRRAVLADGPRLIGPAVAVAIETGWPMPAVLTGVVRDADLPVSALIPAYRSIPPNTTALRDLAAAIAERAVAGDVPRGTAEDASMRIEFAERLLETGDDGRATTAARQAAEAARPFADREPAMMVNALRVLSACQSNSGDHAAAIETAERAVSLLALLGLDTPRVSIYAWYTVGERRRAGGDPRAALPAYDRVVDTANAYLEELRRSPGPDLLWIPRRAPDVAADPRLAASQREILALALRARAGVHRELGSPAAAVADARRAVGLLADLAADMPDAYDSPYANALLELGRALATASDASIPPDEDAGLLVRGNLLWISLVLGREAAQRGNLGILTEMTGLGVGAARNLDPEVMTTLCTAFTSEGLAWLNREKSAQARVFITAAVECARAIAEKAPEEARLPLPRALMAQARWQEATGDPDSARASAAEAVAILEAGHPLARAAAANTLSIRLDHSGRPDEAFEAAETAVHALMSSEDPLRDDVVPIAATGLAHLLRLAGDTGRSGDVADDVLHYAVAVLTAFADQRASDRILEEVAALAFLTITDLGHRDDLAAVRTAHGALKRLTEVFGDNGMLRTARGMIALNVANAAMRGEDPALMATAYDDVAALAGAWPGDTVIRLEHAKVANFLINVYIDTDLGRAAEVVRSAGAALRSPENLERVQRESADDPDEYLAWLDQIIAAGEGDDSAALVSDPAELARFEAEYRAVVADRTAHLGPRHPVTLATKEKLAELLIARQSWADATAVLEDLVDAYAETLGQDHPETTGTREALAWVTTQVERP